LIGLFFIFIQSISGVIRLVIALIFGGLTSFAVKRTKALKQEHPEQYELAQKANNKLNFKRVLLYSILGFFGLIAFIVALGYIIG
jgi:hypothetical protein